MLGVGAGADEDDDEDIMLLLVARDADMDWGVLEGATRKRNITDLIYLVICSSNQRS